ncbi:hypothetical protein SLNHY_6684 [Streptomyces albus]|nr:hypothetical protein SLNHY_6684 [Streptomyces albus]
MPVPPAPPPAPPEFLGAFMHRCEKQGHPGSHRGRTPATRHSMDKPTDADFPRMPRGQAGS